MWLLLEAMRAVLNMPALRCAEELQQQWLQIFATGPLLLHPLPPSREEGAGDSRRGLARAE